jgi:SAM-dependent methyltransferase
MTSQVLPDAALDTRPLPAVGPGHIPCCRSCGASGGELSSVLDLGRTPLANRLLPADRLAEPEPTYPLELVFCSRCSLLQITETVPPEDLFREYVYFSSFSDTMLRHVQELAERMIRERGLNHESLVMEAASNDGYLLKNYAWWEVPVLGIEPAYNIAAVAREKGVPTLTEFFGLELADRLRAEGRRADVFHGHNVLAHVADLNGFVAGIARVLKPEGVAVIEVPYVQDMIDHVEFDTIYHEHLCYFSVTALDRLFRRHGLLIVNAERVAIHGGSLRFFAQPDPDATGKPRARKGSVTGLLAEEAGRGMDRLAFYRGFGARVQALREELRQLLGRVKAENKRIAVYGASAKGSTLLNYLGVGPETFEFVADRSSIKQGRYTPGTHLPIVPPERLLDEAPDFVLMLTWNFRDEILRQQEEYRRRGGRFIIPLPRLEVV